MNKQLLLLMLLIVTSVFAQTSCRSHNDCNIGCTCELTRFGAFCRRSCNGWNCPYDRNVQC
jgi:hypothetical protein